MRPMILDERAGFDKAKVEHAELRGVRSDRHPDEDQKGNVGQAEFVGEQRRRMRSTPTPSRFLK